MKKSFSVHWKSSKQPRKQRKYKYNAPFHIRRRMLSAHLDKSLREKYKRRSFPLRKGDKIKIMRGNDKGKTSTVSIVDLKAMKVYLEDIKRKNSAGREIHTPFEASNLLITELNLDDKMRKRAIERRLK